MRYIYSYAVPLGIAIIFSMAFGLQSPKPVLAEDKPTLSKLKLHPAPEPQPALQYRLLPSCVDLTPGNAALEYNRIVVQWQTGNKDYLEEKLSEWLEMPIEKIPRETIRRILSENNMVLEGITTATLRNRCDWQLPLHESSNPLNILIPELTQMRSLGEALGS